MGGRETRQRLVSAFIAGLVGFGMLSAHDVLSPDSALEQQADAEFARAGLAVRERLDREAAGDPLGASIAAHEAELHRYRYLDVKREINRRHPQSTAFPSVAAPRDPFIPDGAFSADSGASATRAVPRTAGGHGEVIPAPYRSWDMYRPRLSMDGAGAGSTESSPAMQTAPVASAMGPAKDLYAPDGPTHAPSDQLAPSAEPEALSSSTDGPRQPFLVYREQSAGPSTREHKGFWESAVRR